MKFELYKDTKGEWRWRLRAANGNILANCGEGYKNRKDCFKVIQSIAAGVGAAEVEESSKEEA